MFEDAVERELSEMRKRGEREESRHDCKGCRDRVGVPCLKAYRCERLRKEHN